ncbi:hypothetical protein N7460_007214 [Penicillium canescens]|uniref:Uncharacterized protein n=1 Tax=Penicillium canescens TaxID=5083 RepID=A0AAD6IAQ1_PENCN|nr:hypothetical protein N7460_007214 [Penicillium canescens]
MERGLERTNLALRLADIFRSLTSQRLDVAFKTTHEIQRSKADKVVAIEMFHVKLYEETYMLDKSYPTTVRIFHV